MGKYYLTACFRLQCDFRESNIEVKKGFPVLITNFMLFIPYIFSQSIHQPTYALNKIYSEVITNSYMFRRRGAIIKSFTKQGRNKANS
jgi:hypothetical protein